MARNTKAAVDTGKYKKSEFAIVNKIGTKSMGNGADVVNRPKVGDVMLLGTIMGIATSTKKGKSQYGEFMGLLGSFRYIPADPAGQKLQSGICYLPGSVTGQLSAALVDGGSAQFAFEVSTVKADRKDSPIGYTYRLVPLVEDENDPMEMLMNKIEIPMLPAPAG